MNRGGGGIYQSSGDDTHTTRSGYTLHTHMWEREAFLTHWSECKKKTIKLKTHSESLGVVE